jgi:signal peptidase II
MRVLWLSGLVLFIDQLTKAAVLEYMYRGQSIPLIGDWLKFTFTENPGMAFGIEVGPQGTVAVLALLAMCLVAYYFYHVRHSYLPYRLSLALIFGGAIGNIIDRVFYGVILGYGELFRGKVVDFIHVSVWEGWIPEFIPLYGGSFTRLFPIWNVADMAIVGGVIGVLLFHHRFHEQEMKRLAREAMGIVAVEPAQVKFPLPPFVNASSDPSESANGVETEAPDAGDAEAGETVSDSAGETSYPA